MNKPNTANSQGNFGEDKESSVINHIVKSYFSARYSRKRIETKLAGPKIIHIGMCRFA